MFNASESMSGCSLRHLVLVSIIATAYRIAESSGSNAYQLKSPTLGLSMKNTPKKPIKTANHPLREIDSPTMIEENSVMKIGSV